VQPIYEGLCLAENVVCRISQFISL